MKYLVLLLVLVAVLWIARALRAPAARKPPRPAQPTGAVGHEDLPACAHCGVYLPRSEALEGPGGVFCSEAHRAAFQARERPR